MSHPGMFTRLKRYQQRLNGCTIVYDLSPYQHMVSEINAAQSTLSAQSDLQLQGLSEALRAKVAGNTPLDSLLIDAFSLVKEAVRRVLHIEAFDEQIIGAIVMHQTKLAEMQTGEGKTLAAVFPAFLNALSSKGVHVLTFNDYLAQRDAQWMGPVYEFLGLRVGFVREGMSIAARQSAYSADITYLTAKEAGFDFLRDSLCYRAVDRVHRPLHFAIVDEADSILIDEARIPLIIAGAYDESSAREHSRHERLLHMACIAHDLQPDADFAFDDYRRNVHLTEQGTNRIEAILQCGNIYNEENIDLLAGLSHALHAEFLLHIDKDYIIRNSRVELVDEFTGRVADKRRWPDGLQAAVEAKEGCLIQSKGTILNSIALQHFIQLYPFVCGMTATAQVSEEEFREFYDLHIVVIPPHSPCIRQDHRDIIFASKKDKQQALLHEITGVHAAKRPILVGTHSVEESAALAQALRETGIRCEVLNAKNDEHEAAIIAQAGGLGALTISTNMAGRGTDIRLGGADEAEKALVAALGGLYVIGTNRYESRRIDNQLRGRAGRQGDPGSSRFFISLEDELCVQYRLAELIPSHHIFRQADGTIDGPMVRNEVGRVQRIVEGQNLEIKTTLYKYAFLIEQQRQIHFQRREAILTGASAAEWFEQRAPERFKAVRQSYGSDKLLEICRQIYLNTMDLYWSRYCAEITDIREGIHLRRIGGQDPLYEFHKIVIALFDTIGKEIEREALSAFNAVKETDRSPEIKSPSATWTYLINDNPFDPMLETQLVSNIGFNALAGLQWPLVALYFLLRKRSGKKASSST
jgi:preprotein translocase subunit SecA